MVATNAEEAPLGFAGDVDGGSSFQLSSGRTAPPPSQNSSNNNSAAAGLATSGGSTAPVKVDLLPPPSLRDRGLVGGGVLLTGAKAGRSVLAWRGSGSGLWLEERGLDDDLDGGGLHLKLQGEARSAVGRGGRGWGWFVLCFMSPFVPLVFFSVVDHAG